MLGNLKQVFASMRRTSAFQGTSVVEIDDLYVNNWPTVSIAWQKPSVKIRKKGRHSLRHEGEGSEIVRSASLALPFQRNLYLGLVSELRINWYRTGYPCSIGIAMQIWRRKGSAKKTGRARRPA